MQSVPLRAALKAALLAGLAAALLAAAFHSVVTERVIDRAIAFEEQPFGQPAAEAGPAPAVSRDVQRAGLWLGLLIYGLSWALLFGAFFYLAQGWLPGAGAAQQGLILAALGYWSIALLPFLKYPANPPGVGEAETIGLRQNLYFGLLAASLAGAGLSLLLQRHLRQRLAGAQAPAHSAGAWAVVGGRPWLAALGCLALYSLVVYLALPDNPDAIRVPAGLVASFRAFSLIGLSLFWAVFGLGFAWLLGRAKQAQSREKRAMQARPRGSRA